MKILYIQFDLKKTSVFSVRNFWKRGVLRDSPDLENIANFRETYFTSFCPSFWVAEKQTPTCKEIVGTIAVRHVIGNLKERALNHQITKSFELRVSHSKLFKCC